MSEIIEVDVRLLAAVSYGEASVVNNPDEIAAIAFAVANRCRAWGGKTVSELKAADPNYAYAWDGSNARFNKLMKAGDADLKKDKGLALAVELARKAIANEITDPSSGAFWWDGFDFKTNYANHPKVRDGFRWGDPSHNIFGLKENLNERVVRWKIKNKKTGQIVDGAERGRYEAVWISTSAYGSTIFWKHDADYLKATGGKAYR